MIEPVRFSRLKLIGRSPEHYLANPQKKGSWLERGSGVHLALLKNKRLAFYPKLTDAGKAAPRNGKDWEAFRADNADALILSRTDYDDAQRMADAVRRNRDAMEALEGVAEDTILFDYMGRACRTTPDIRGLGHVTELKSSRSSHPVTFRWDAMKLRYHAQMAFHGKGMGSILTGPPDHYFIVAVESEFPHPVVVHELTKRAVTKGMRLIDAWMERLLACETDGSYPGYADDFVEFDVSDEDEARFGPAIRD